MKMHLDSINALDIVLGNKIQPEQNDTECENWRHRKAKAKACSLGIRGYILDYSAAQKMWQRLKDRLDAASSAEGRQLLKRIFLTTSPEVGKSISDYISKPENLRFQLTGTPQEIDDETFKDQILCCLPDGFQNVVEIINDKQETLTPVQVIKKNSPSRDC
jgi:hypothetical protein